MSKYTTEVRYICERAAGLDESVGFNDVDEVIEAAIPGIFSFDFPVFDENYRNVICSKILRHYYTREIGFETVGLWKLKLQTRLDEIMPYYNQLYKSELIKFNPLYDTDLQTTNVSDKNSETNREEAKTGTSIGSSNTAETGGSSGTSRSDTAGSEVETGKTAANKDRVASSNQNDSESGSLTSTASHDKVVGSNTAETDSNTHYDIYSDTPQGALTGVDSGEYLTNARKITDSGSKTGKRNDTEAGTDTGESTNSVSKTGSKEDSEFSAESGTSENTKATAGNVHDAYEDSSSGSRNSSDTRLDNSSLTGTDKYNSTESYVLHVVGKQSGASYSSMLKEFRDTFLNIDMDVINALADLFFNLW